ncbi:hypothetical protein F5J12DRAFT_901449 [Pisolithus orientalis]|uniref:uncharacterized protein n=1 Tax=Pisolithus orientalis TaxID=936130 RepID=UPI002225065C|nr:uncharacterized protein F5J12DRAFT_901449 [Pisolithus orientalis]KAI5980477.1 hypothetical protein F5J12DRAFT_901526 [Pisolithus orientalis]KAI5980522.1 hypothetical protein F5J12DRAFT_901449 [Pisolithus orientalis]
MRRKRILTRRRKTYTKGTFRHGRLTEICLASGLPHESNPGQLGKGAPIMFDTRKRFEDTPWENYVQFWCTQGNTIPYSNRPDTRFLRRSDRIMMTGLCFRGLWSLSAQSEWKVRFLFFHSAEKPDNPHVVNDWLYNEESYIPVGVEQSTYPAVEGTGGTEMVYLPFSSWVSRHAHLNHTRRDEIMKVVPYEHSGKPVRVLLDVTRIFRNRGSRAKTISFNILKRMRHKYLYESKYGAAGERAFGDIQLGKSQPTMKLYVMILAHALVPCPRMADPNLPQEAMAGIEEWPMGLRAAARRARKLDDPPPTGAVAPSGQVIFAGNQMTMPELADRQDSIVHQSASHFRHGIRKEYEGGREGMPDGIADLPDYDGDEFTEYQQSWQQFDGRRRPTMTRVFAPPKDKTPVTEGSLPSFYNAIPDTYKAVTSGTSASSAPKWSANPTVIDTSAKGFKLRRGLTPGSEEASGSGVKKDDDDDDDDVTVSLTPKGKGKGKGKAKLAEHIRGGAGPGDDEGLDLGLFSDALDNPKAADIEEKEVPNAEMEVEPDDPYRRDPLCTGPPFGSAHFQFHMRVWYKNLSDRMIS